MDILGISRTYLKLKKPDFMPIHPFDLDVLLELYAKAKMYKDPGLKLLDGNGHMARRKTMGCLVSAANSFINGLDYVLAEESMTSYTSKRQIKALRNALLANGKKKMEISGFSMILLHCAYMEIMDSPIRYDCFNVLNDLATVIHQLTLAYYEVYPDDEIARFLMNSYTPFNTELDQRRCLSKEDFPDIPKKSLHTCPDDQ